MLSQKMTLMWSSNCISAKLLVYIMYFIIHISIIAAGISDDFQGVLEVFYLNEILIVGI